MYIVGHSWVEIHVDSFQKFVLSFHPVKSWDETQVLRARILNALAI